MEQIDNLKELINQGDVDIAIKQLDQLLQDDSVEKDKDMPTTGIRTTWNASC